MDPVSIAASRTEYCCSCELW